MPKLLVILVFGACFFRLRGCRAKDLFHEVPRQLRDVVCLNATISACSKGTALASALKLLETDIKLDVVSYGGPINPNKFDIILWSDRIFDPFCPPLLRT